MKVIYYISLIIVGSCALLQCKKSSEKTTPAGGGNPTSTNAVNSSPGAPGKEANAGQGPVYTAVQAKGYVLNREITSPGSIQSEENTNLQPEISGRITGIYFKEGAVVSKGALLVKLYDADLKAQRSKLEVQLKIAEASEKRQKDLLAVFGTSQQEYDLATLSVSNIKADLDLNEVSLSKTEIRAPYTGKIGLRNVSLGAYIIPSTIISNIAQISTLKIEFNVLEKYAQELKIGKTVTFKTESSSQTYQAKITAFENSLTTDTRQLRIRAQVIRPDNRLTPGSFISVNFGVGSQAPAIMIPSQAIIPQARDKKLIVYKNGVANFITVITGYRDSSRVEIIEGIKTGDTVLTTGLLTLRPNAKINVVVTE
ncbi:MAG: efflux RND transporter periplasmic adaptor subunit [Saprospiraceae bacterium]